jgi:acetolactate synthase I/II/III large subunit
MKVSDIIVKALEAEGVTEIFGVPGEENEDFLFSLSQSKEITFIPTRHEQGAAFMANVYGRLTGKAGVCLATLGPGATNLLTGIADAQLDKAPVVAITGQGSSDRLHKESHQNIDVVGMFKPVTKWSSSIQNPDIAGEVVRKAFKLAEMEKPGATHFELPEDVAKAMSPTKTIRPVTLRRPMPDRQSLAFVLELLTKSHRPIILAGNGAIRKRASEQLRTLVQKFDIPVVHTFMGKGAISDKDPHSLYSIGLQGRDYVMCAIEHADLILTVGYDIAEYDPRAWNKDSAKPLVHIDFEPAEVYYHYQPEVEIVADISNTLEALSFELSKTKLTFESGWAAKIRERIEADFEAYRLSNGDDFTIPGALHLIRENMRPGDLLISDVGSHKMWIGRNYPVYEPNSVIISNGLASMGISLPGAIAAKRAFPDKRVVAAMGDGGFLMNCQEIETAKRLGLAFTIIVFNDNDYGLISWKQKAHSGRSFGTGLSNPSYIQFAESFGIKGYSPKNLVELKSTLQQTIQGNELSIVEIAINPKVNYELTQKLSGNICPFIKEKERCHLCFQ